jgi:DNA-binding GntR family transcriptional regulator
VANATLIAYELIREGILSGEYARGERLREEELAVRAGVSRTPVREALRRLDAEGLVGFTPNRGARVTAWSQQELEDLYDVRALLEGHGARLAASRITTEEIDSLSSLADQMESIGGKGRTAADELTRLNGEFHRSIVRATRNSQLESLVRSMMEVPLIYRTFQRYSPERLQSSSFQHRELIMAMQAANGDWAEAVMRAHILAARAWVLEPRRPGTASAELSSLPAPD